MENLNELNDVSLLTNFQETVGEWASTTFPEATNQSRIEHMRMEIEELKLEPSDPMEAADILLLLLDHAYHNNYDLLTAGKKKFKIIQGRTWGPPNDMGVVEHIRSEDEST